MKIPAYSLMTMDRHLYNVAGITMFVSARYPYICIGTVTRHHKEIAKPFLKIS